MSFYIKWLGECLLNHEALPSYSTCGLEAEPRVPPFNKRSQSLPGKLDIKRRESDILFRFTILTYNHGLIINFALIQRHRCHSKIAMSC